MTEYKVCEEGTKIKDLLSKSGLVISGHFHTRHEKQFGAGTILYVGNPFQMDFGDAGNQKGYHILDLDTLEYEFKPNNISPNYKKINLSELVEEGSITPITVNNIANNFVRLKIDMNISQQDMDILYDVLSKLKPESLTIDYDINFNRILENTEQKEDLSGIDVKQAIVEFVNMLDIDNADDIIDYTLNLYEKC